MNLKDCITDSMISEVLDGLTKKAKGYMQEEISEEYAIEEGKEILVKKKVTKKYIPADLSASKLLIELVGDGESKNYASMSDAELDQEAIRLFKEYEKLSNENIFKDLKGEE